MEVSKNVPKDFVTPEGGWGYVITISIVIMNYVSLIPTMTFTLLYGGYLETLGDETGLTALALQIFLGVMSVTGCFSGFIMSKCGYRLTGFIGATAYFLGAFGEHYGTSFVELVLCTSVLKGIGYGLMQILSISLLNVYFDKKLNLAMGFSQALIALGTIAAPQLTTYLMKVLGTKNTIWFFTGLSLLNFPAMATYKPVSGYLKNIPVEALSNRSTVMNQGNKLSPESDLRAQEPLLREDEEVAIAKSQQMWVAAKSWILDDVGFRLFNRLTFWNITFGLAVAYNTDILFFNLIRVMMSSLHYEIEDISFTMMIFFVSDVVGRVSYAIMSGFWTVKNRYVFLTASIFINVCRIMFFFRDDFMWKLIIIAMVGWLRAFLETPLPLVISEYCKNDFPKAFSMYYILLGFVCLSSSPLTGLIKTITGKDSVVVYVYAGINYVCCLTWLIEILQGSSWKWFCRRKGDC